jgi:hypothetical protein
MTTEKDSTATNRAAFGNGNGRDACECCGKKVNLARGVWLEHDQRIDAFHDYEFGVPADRSQGWFLFGPDCAARLLRDAKERAKSSGIFLGRKRIGKVGQAALYVEFRKR